jgi:hypothetical protein
LSRGNDLKSSATKALNEGWSEIPPPGKSRQLAFGCFGGQDDDPAACNYINTLKTELANSYYWSGGPCYDYIFFVCNWHPIIGILFCHPNHPWTKRERFLMMLVSMCITLVPAAFIGKTFANDAVAMKLFTILGVTIPDTVFGLILYQLSIAETRWFCKLCLPLWTCIQQGLFCIAFVIGGVSTLICYTILQDNGVTHWDKMLKPLITGLGVSYVTWFPLWLIIPCELGFISNWCAEKSRGVSKAASMEQQARSGAME